MTRHEQLAALIQAAAAGNEKALDALSPADIDEHQALERQRREREQEAAEQAQREALRGRDRIVAALVGHAR